MISPKIAEIAPYLSGFHPFLFPVNHSVVADILGFYFSVNEQNLLFLTADREGGNQQSETSGLFSGFVSITTNVDSPGNHDCGYY